MSENSPDARHPAVATDAEVAVLDSLVSMVEESRRGRAAFEAMELQALAGLSALAGLQRDRLPEKRAVRELPLREIAAEVAMAVRLSDRAVQGMITDAAITVELFPATVTALSEGRISRGHVTALVDAGAAFDDAEARTEFEAAALVVASRESVGRFRSVVRGMAERMNPRSMTERHALAREDRGTRVRELPDGMGELVLTAPAVIVYGVQDRLTQQVKMIQNQARADANEQAGVAGFVPDERTLGQIRADLAGDLLLTGAPTTDPTGARVGAVNGDGSGDGPGLLGAVRALVQLTVPVLTAAGVDDDLVELDGRIPIDPETARELMKDTPGWDRVLTHPITGAVLTVDRYTPNADLKRTKQATDRRCRCPGCRMPAHRCDLDHNQAASEGGATEECNLCAFCRRHHVLKHRPGWKVRQLPGGRIEWTTPTGRVYIDEPPPRAVYLPHPPPKREDNVDLADRGRTTTNTPADLMRRLRPANGANGNDRAGRNGQRGRDESGGRGGEASGGGGGDESGRGGGDESGGRGGDESGRGGGDESGGRGGDESSHGTQRPRTVTFIPDGDNPPF